MLLGIPMGTGHTDRLFSLLRQAGVASEPEAKMALMRLAEEARERKARGALASVDFFSSTLRAVSNLRGTSNSDLRMSCLYDCAAFFFHKGQSERALHAVRELTRLAAVADDEIWLGKANTIAGVVYADVGNICEAFAHHAAALNTYREQGNALAEAKVLLNLGVTLNYGGLYREAIPCFLSVAAAAGKDDAVRELVATASVNLAQSYFYLEEFAKGFSAACKSLELSAPPIDASASMSRTIREFTFVQLALELAKYDLALEHSVMCTRFAVLAGPGPWETMARIANGLCEINTGNVSHGLSLLESTLQMCVESDSIQSDALIALIKAYDHAGQPDRALNHLQALMHHIRSKREKGLLSLLSLPLPLSPRDSVVDGSIDLRAFELREAKLRTEVAVREIANSRIEMLERLAITADLKEEESGEHGYRVGRLASLLAIELDWDRDRVASLDLAARLHDIGKMSVPDRIVFNSDELNEAERHFMSMHTIIGAELLAKSNVPQLRMAEEIARYHHEWWNGAGYPSKFTAKRIPIHARIVALADVFDALTHGRPFARPWSADDALGEIRRRRGTQFDPDLTDRFLLLVERLRTENPDLDGYLGRASRSSPFLQARCRIRSLISKERQLEQSASISQSETRH